MEGMAEPTALLVPSLGSRAALPPLVTCASPGGQGQLSLGLGRAGRRGSLLGGVLAPSPLHSSSAFIPLSGDCPHLLWYLSTSPS